MEVWMLHFFLMVPSTAGADKKKPSTAGAHNTR